MARKNNRKFALAVLSALSVLGSQSLAMNTGNKVDSRGAVQPVSRGSDKTTKMSPKDNAIMPATFATLFGLGLAYEVLGNVFDLPTASKGIRYLAGKDKKSGDKVKVGILPVITKTKYIKEKEYILIKEKPQIVPRNNGYDPNEHEFSGMQEARMFNLQSLFYQFILNQKVYVDENKFKICKCFGTPERQVRNDCHLKFWQMIYSVVRISNANNLESSGLTEGLFGDFVRMFKYEDGDSALVFGIDNSNIKFENKKKNEVINTKISFEQLEVEATPNPEDDVLFFVNFQMNDNTRYRVTFRKECFFVEKQQSTGDTFDEWNNVEGGKSKNINYLDGKLHGE